jgi:hypothetical protein
MRIVDINLKSSMIGCRNNNLSGGMICRLDVFTARKNLRRIQVVDVGIVLLRARIQIGRMKKYKEYVRCVGQHLLLTPMN